MSHGCGGGGEESVPNQPFPIDGRVDFEPRKHSLWADRVRLLIFTTECHAAGS
jgi:hypothetical protein